MVGYWETKVRNNGRLPAFFALRSRNPPGTVERKIIIFTRDATIREGGRLGPASRRMVSEHLHLNTTDAMKIRLLVLSWSLAATLSLNAQAPAAPGELAAFVERYAASINAADTVMARSLWADTPELSFIHPRGTAYGWTGVLGVYRMFGAQFSQRNLQPRNVTAQAYGDVAWLTFEWVFDAVFRENGAPMQSQGRETQVLRKVDGEWRLVHIHYSGPPTVRAREGF